ncbi:B-cell receptor CD22-like [Archocentrus centrarchus]|uniref:B-cell receptor CD22-like n=1 Tax=Archocentrus centrarchus TaxID=63155 RepID=UPI0011E9C8C1|nr:B-cell receptor CD22-like [Archocentrus centrarchus]
MIICLPHPETACLVMSNFQNQITKLNRHHDLNHRETRGAAMSLTAAASGFVLFLLSLPVMRSQDYGVTYTSTQICALKGSTVEIGCFFKDRVKVLKKAWFTEGNDDLKTDSAYGGRVTYDSSQKSCALTIRELRESDSAVYKFRFETNQEGGSYTGSPGVTLTVTALQVHVGTSSYYRWAELTCQSSCRLPNHPSFIWYKNGQKIYGQTNMYWYLYKWNYLDSYSCAASGHEALPSPSVCVRGHSCNRVNYSNRNICAFKGSSVDISCTYNSYYQIQSKSWFCFEHGYTWTSKDLSKDSQYEGRVEVTDTMIGGSTLRIRDLRESDSAEYHFKFKTRTFEWKNSLPGTTLTVAALQVKVSRIISVHQSHTEAELTCFSSCRPDGHLSFVWFKNNQFILENNPYQDRFNPGDIISCAFKGYENDRSAPVYALKPPSVSVSPSAEIVEGSSVTLTCSSDANPAANYTWYKEQKLIRRGQQFIFESIQSSDSGEYYCTTENELGKRSSEYISINVKYAPKLPSVSVSPSAEIVEGSSVTLTCSSDANPAANYTWYKEDEDSPKASGQNFIITDIRPEHSGSYYCEAQNTRGRHNSTLQLTVVSSSRKSAAFASITVVFLAFIILSGIILIRRKRCFKANSSIERPDNRAEGNTNDYYTLSAWPEHHGPSAAAQSTAAEQQDDVCYASVSFFKKQEEPDYYNIIPTQPKRQNEDEEVEDVEYTHIRFSSTQRLRHHQTVEYSSAVYGTVNRK